MEVVDGLAAVVAGVDDQAVPVGEAVCAGEVGGYGGEVAEERGVFLGDVGERGEVLLGDDKEVGGGLGVDVGKGDGLVVFMEALGGDGAGDDLAEEAVGVGGCLGHAEILSPGVALGRLRRQLAAATDLGGVSATAAIGYTRWK